VLLGLSCGCRWALRAPAGDGSGRGAFGWLCGEGAGLSGCSRCSVLLPGGGTGGLWVEGGRAGAGCLNEAVRPFLCCKAPVGAGDNGEPAARDPQPPDRAVPSAASAAFRGCVWASGA